MTVARPLTQPQPAGEQPLVRAARVARAEGRERR
jgi:hypothetical protein